MTEPENIKVYELAKELGMDSISLLDKLRTLNIVVKSHMSGLTSDEVLRARENLLAKSVASDKIKKTKTAKVPARTATTRKKAANGQDAETAPTPKKTEKRKETKESKDSGDEPSPKRTIIRRRASGGSEPAFTSSKSSEAYSSQEPDLSTVASTSPDHAPPNEDSSQVTPEQPPTATTEPEGTEDLSLDAAASAAKKSILQVANPAEARRTGLKIVKAAEPAAARGPMIRPVNRGETPTITGVGKKKTLFQEGEGFGPDGATRSGRIIKMNKESLDKMAADEAAKRRPGGLKELLKPEDANYSDYKKREMVFLPKRKRIPVGKELRKTQLTTRRESKRVVEMQNQILVSDFANQMGIKSGVVIKKLMGMGQTATVNQAIDFDTAVLIATEFGWDVKNVAFKEETFLGKKDITDTTEELVPRPPVVTIMGHVDHGKTSLLDAIRETNVVAKEAGGITQHIGAYTIQKDGQPVTFIDTPGHEAFTAMRARGANLTDIVVLVVAADDGVMPQTREAINHAQAAKVPIIVAVNKIDKPGANIEKIKQGLSEFQLLAEDWGGETIFVPCSATQKTGIDKLLEAILLTAEMLELKSNPNTLAQGVILESRLEKGRGPVATVLITRGTLKKTDTVVAGEHMGRVKAMKNWKGEILAETTPGIAVEILGLEGVPEAGDKFYQTKSDMDAKKIIDHRLEQKRLGQSATRKMTLEDLFAQAKTGDVKELKVILKADVSGSVEAVKESLIKLSTDKIKLTVILAATGGITESDVLLASASNAIIIGFHVRPETKALKIAENEKIEVTCYSIIYELLDEVKKSMGGLLDKKKVETFLGRAEVRQVFSIPKSGTIAGSYVVEGKIVRGAGVRLLRDSVIVHEGKMTSLRRFKNDAKEVQQGFECGIGIEGYNDIKPGDLIEAYQIDMVAQEL